jgi:hypothetical protein
MGTGIDRRIFLRAAAGAVGALSGSQKIMAGDMRRSSDALQKETPPTVEATEAEMLHALRAYYTDRDVLLQPSSALGDVGVKKRLETLLLRTTVGPLQRPLQKYWGLIGTKYDIAKQFTKDFTEQYPTASIVSDSSRIDGYELVHPNHVSLLKRLQETAGRMQYGSVGSIFALETEVDGMPVTTLVTNKHVVAALRGEHSTSTISVLDVATLPVSATSKHMPPVLHILDSIGDAQVEGSFVVVAGTDNDGTVMGEGERAPGVLPGAKMFGGIATPFTPILQEYIRQQSPMFNDALHPGFAEAFLSRYHPGVTKEEWKRDLLAQANNSFIFRLSSIEGTVHIGKKYDEHGGVVFSKSIAAQGTSGSPVFTFDMKTNRWELAGINHAGVSVYVTHPADPSKKVPMYLGLFHGPDALRKGVKESLEREKNSALHEEARER